MKLKSSTYDKLKILSMIVGYAATFILTVADIWGFSQGAAVAATVSAFGIFLGSILKVSSDNYNKEHNELPSDDSEE